MRVVLAIAIATFTFGLISRPMLAQGSNNVPALESIHMINSLIGWAVTNEQDAKSGSPSNALVRSTDGGVQWRDVTPPFGPQQRVFYLHATNVAMLTSLFAWVGPFRTVNGGRTWRNVPTPGVIRSIHFINARDGWLLSFQGAHSASVETGVYRSTDGGETWAKVASSRNGATGDSDLPDVVGGDPHITFLNATTGWITRSDPVLLPEWSYLYVTHDGGRIWRRQKLPVPPQLTTSWVGIKPPKFFTAQDGILPVFYAGLDPQSHRAISPSVVLYVTHDGGTTWRYTTPISVREWGPLSFTDINHGWLGDRNILYTTIDGGRQWTSIRPDLFTDVRQLDFISPRVGWAVRQTFPFLLKTLDGGRMWTPVTYTIIRQ